MAEARLGPGIVSTFTFHNSTNSATGGIEMRTAPKTVLLLAVLGTALAYAQNSAIQHIIVVVQENRTPDNLFQDPVLTAAGADIAQNGPCGLDGIKLQKRPLADCYDLNHYHVGWKDMYDGGKMDGACTVPIINDHCVGGPPPFPQYVYADNTSGAIQPYWDIAEKYGYANYFFQTNQGPSFPAHQFLISGTSEPDGVLNPFYAYFAADNPGGSRAAGCNSSGSTVALISPAGDENTQVAPCFEHPTLTDLLDQHSPSPITWRYYGKKEDSIWEAPNAIGHICNNTGQGMACGTGNGSNHDWNNDVGPYVEADNHLAPFLADLKNCNLAQVTWVTPDGRWGDHPYQSIGLGPDYVADIVNAIGQGMPNSTCNPLGSPIYWNNTVILIVWDDWGGFYDHVSPQTPTGPGIGYPNGTGDKYVYGFRVPLLVVSTFAKQHYISGPKTNPIYYDFGSILKFIEETFLPSNTFINPVYPYADQFVDTRVPKADLSDFFDCFGQQCHPFQPINLQYSTKCTSAPPPNGCGATQCRNNGTECLCDTSCIIKYPGTPFDPDDD
jgi:phospholipase C